MPKNDPRGKHEPHRKAGEDTRDAQGARAGSKPGHKGAGTRPFTDKGKGGGRGGGPPDPPRHGGRGGGNSN